MLLRVLSCWLLACLQGTTSQAHCSSRRRMTWRGLRQRQVLLTAVLGSLPILSLSFLRMYSVDTCWAIAHGNFRNLVPGPPKITALAGHLAFGKSSAHLERSLLNDMHAAQGVVQQGDRSPEAVHARQVALGVR